MPITILVLVKALVADPGALTNQLLCAVLTWVPPTCSLLISPRRPPPHHLLIPYLSLLQGARSWKDDDSPVANGGTEPAGRRRRDREPGREERKEEEKLKTSQVDSGLWAEECGLTGLASVQCAERSSLQAPGGK